MTDCRHMFFQRITLELSPDALRALHPSLNTPVVGLEDEPAGPARAALAVLQGDDGRARVVVAIRVLTQESAATYAPDEASASSESTDLLIGSALAFAESMGFLLDDDLLAEAGPHDASIRQRARTLWSELLGSTFVEFVKPELEIEDVPPADSLSVELRGADAPTEVFRAPANFRAPASPSPPRRVSLSKFRVAPSPVPVPDAAPPMTNTPTSGDEPEISLAVPEFAPVSNDASDPVPLPPTGVARLGRVRLLRRRSNRTDLPRPGWLQRLLSAF